MARFYTLISPPCHSERSEESLTHKHRNQLYLHTPLSHFFSQLTLPVIRVQRGIPNLKAPKPTLPTPPLYHTSSVNLHFLSFRAQRRIPNPQAPKPTLPTHPFIALLQSTYTSCHSERSEESLTHKHRNQLYHTLSYKKLKCQF